MHDYVQMVFDQEILSIYNQVEVRAGSDRFDSTRGRLAEALIQLIGLQVESIHEDPDAMLRLRFENGSDVAILDAEPGCTRLEAFQFAGQEVLVVGENARPIIEGA